MVGQDSRSQTGAYCSEVLDIRVYVVHFDIIILSSYGMKCEEDADESGVVHARHSVQNHFIDQAVYTPTLQYICAAAGMPAGYHIMSYPFHPVLPISKRRKCDARS